MKLEARWSIAFWLSVLIIMSYLAGIGVVLRVVANNTTIESALVLDVLVAFFAIYKLGNAIKDYAFEKGGGLNGKEEK